MTRRLELLYTLHQFIADEIADELGPHLAGGPDNPLLMAVAQLYEIDPHHILGKGHGPRVVKARAGLAWLLHRDGMSLGEIADCLGYGDSVTARRACARVAADPGAKALLLTVHPHPTTAEETQPE